MANDVSLLETKAVASRAIHTLHLHLSTNTFLSSYKAVAQSDSILALTVGAPTPAEAIARNQAIDAAFLALRAREFGFQTHAVVAVLRSQISTLQHRIQSLGHSINLASTQPGNLAASRLTSLITQKDNEQAQAVQLQANVQQDVVALASLTHGSGVLDPPALLEHSRYKATLIDGLSGLVAGLALAFALVGLRALLSDRPRTREEIATLLGAPVELSLGRRGRLADIRYRQLDHLLKRPSPSLVAIERRLKAQVQLAPKRALAIVALGTEGIASRAVARLAISLASEGKRVVLADDTRSHRLGRLLPGQHARGTFTAVTIEGHELQLYLGGDDPGDMTQQGIPDATDVVLVLTDPDPAFGLRHLAAWVSHAVVLVSRESTSTARIATTAQLLHHEKIAISSTILVGALPDDESLGIAQRRLSSIDSRRLATLETAPS